MKTSEGLQNSSPASLPLQKKAIRQREKELAKNEKKLAKQLAKESASRKKEERKLEREQMEKEYNERLEVQLQLNREHDDIERKIAAHNAIQKKNSKEKVRLLYEDSKRQMKEDRKKAIQDAKENANRRKTAKQSNSDLVRSLRPDTYVKEATKQLEMAKASRDLNSDDIELTEQRVDLEKSFGSRVSGKAEKKSRDKVNGKDAMECVNQEKDAKEFAIPCGLQGEDAKELVDCDIEIGAEVLKQEPVRQYKNVKKNNQPISGFGCWRKATKKDANQSCLSGGSL